MANVVADKPSHLSTDNFDNFYDIDKTANQILSGNYMRIALQFPDELLHDSILIYGRLKRRVGDRRDIYVLADTSYGSCCVDEIAAKHVDADLMVHYGYACMTQTLRMPVIYVFGKKKINPDACVTSVLKYLTDHYTCSNGASWPKALLLTHDVGYTHEADCIYQMLDNALRPKQIVVRYFSIPCGTQSRNVQEPLPPRTRDIPEKGNWWKSIGLNPKDLAILYIGDANLGLTNMLMTHSLSDIFSYDPVTNVVQAESWQTNKLLMRRYVSVQKARDSDVFGILVGTLGVVSYLPLIYHLRTLLNRHRKKSYTISVGKLNPSKLANFLEIECFVLVACPENSLIDSKDFLKKIVTPFELEVALGKVKCWTGKYVLDFEQLLKMPSRSSERGSCADDDQDKDSDDPVYSLVTGSYRHPKHYSGQNRMSKIQSLRSTSDVIPRNNGKSIYKHREGPAVQFLHTRGYQGLEIRLGEDEVSVLQQGQSGIARKYVNNLEKPDLGV